MIYKASNALFIGLGCLSLILGFVGIFLPLLPTTPFVILAAFLFSRGSKRMHTWLLNHKTLGPGLRDWQAQGIIRRSAKIQATAVIVATFTATLFTINVPPLVQYAVAVTGVMLLVFLWSRPERVIKPSVPAFGPLPRPTPHDE